MYLPIRVSQKYQICVFLLDILHVAAFMPKKVITKKNQEFSDFRSLWPAISFHKVNCKNIQRKILQQTVLAVISHRMV